MVSGSPADTPLVGTLEEVPFLGGNLGERVGPTFADLADEHCLGDVLVLKRFPAGIEDVADELSRRAPGVERPRVETISRHARTVLEERDDPARILTQPERGVLMKRHLEGFAWSNDYLERASCHESFDPDASRFSVESTWQGQSIETDDLVLGELVELNGSFHRFLDDHGYLDRAALLSRAIEILGDDSIRSRVQSEYEALLVVEFEEFTEIDRAYLAHLASGKPLTCVAERDCSIQRTWNEPGEISDRAPGLAVESTDPAPPTTRPEAIATYLATGEDSHVPDRGQVSVVEADTFESQVSAVADEIERLHRREGWSYDSFGVVLRDSNAPIDETVQLLRDDGIPTASATVSGLAHDPIARELYDVARFLRASEPDEREGIWRRLESRMLVAPDDVVDALEEADGLADTLWTWIVETDVKRRIAEGESPLDAKTQFQHVQDVLDLARFLDETNAVEATWEWFCTGLEREFQRASSDKIATELNVEEGGVLVDAVRVFKNVSREAVFLLDVVEDEYPAAPRFNALFPTPQLKTLPEYPAFTTPAAGDVDGTFQTGTDDVDDPLDAYYAELSRRLLAVGARAATDRLYFGTYREKVGDTGRVRQPSRYLQAVEDHFGELDRVDHDEIHSHGRAVRFALSRVDEAFESIRFAKVSEEPVELDEVEADFGAVQAILEDAPDDLGRAVETRTDFAAGRVRRD